VDESFIVVHRDHEQRPLPTFRAEDVSLGKVLGTGGFGIVLEITNFMLHPHDESAATEKPHRCNASSTEENISIDNLNNSNAAPIQRRRQVSFTATKDEEFFSGNSHIHYDVHKAKHWMEQNCVSDGVPRYALKRLQKGLTQLERTRGMLDLAVEAKYLSIVWHPNISMLNGYHRIMLFRLCGVYSHCTDTFTPCSQLAVKIRGIAKGDMIQKDFFIIIDRLHETLDSRMTTWSDQAKRHQGAAFFRSSKNKKILDQLMLDRLTAAYDMSSAFWYLHEHKYVVYQLILCNRDVINIAFSTYLN
jgi:hypothetical protein